ncbi:MAG: VRR-NUC domain-containing protein [Pseudomonadota bacterium]
MRAAKVDNNQGDIIRWFRGLGATVHPCQRVGEGFPDLVVGYRGVNLLVEVKQEGHKLRPNQKDWHEGWKGQCCVVRSLEDVTGLLAGVDQAGEPPEDNWRKVGDVIASMTKGAIS